MASTASRINDQVRGSAFNLDGAGPEGCSKIVDYQLTAMLVPPGEVLLEDSCGHWGSASTVGARRIRCAREPHLTPS